MRPQPHLSRDARNLCAAAEESFERALELNRRDPRPANNLGVMALEAADRAAAAGIGAADYNKNNSNNNNEEEEEAEEAEVAAAALVDDAAPSHEAMSEASSLRNALRWFREASSIDPQDRCAALNVGVALYRLRRDVEAAEHLAAANDAFPGDPRIRGALQVVESALASSA